VVKREIEIDSVRNSFFVEIREVSKKGDYIARF
jgi:hypothetical protein